MILSDVSGVILSDESHEITDKVARSVATLQHLETGVIDPLLWNTELNEKEGTIPSPLRKFGQKSTVLNLATLSKSEKVHNISEKVENMFYMHAHIHVYVCAFSFLAVVTHDNWKLGTFPYSRSGIVPTLYIERLKSFSISAIQFVMQQLHKLPHVCC